MRLFVVRVRRCRSVPEVKVTVNARKTVLGAALLLAGWCSAVHAQPLITGNTSAFGCGPIQTSDYTLGAITQSFFPTGAGVSCPDPPATNNNGRGLAVGGTEIFYTELIDDGNSPPGFGPTDAIRVAPYNSGAGGADTRTLPNPRPGAGIQDLTFANGELFALTGYETDPLIVYGLNLLDGSILDGPITLTGSSNPVIPLPAGPGADGFAVLPNGNFLVNNGDTSCIYNEYDKTTGQLVPSGTINVPGGPGFCTGVDTDGTSLYFLTDFENIIQTDLSGNMTGFAFFDSGNDHQVEDISLVHPVTVLVDAGPGQLNFSLRTTDDINTNFDVMLEILLNGTVIGSGINYCIHSAGPPGTFIPRNLPGHTVSVKLDMTSQPVLVSGDVISARVSTRIGTVSATDPSMCPGPFGAHSNATGIRFFYDAASAGSHIVMKIRPNPGQIQYFHSDGTRCTDGVLGSSVGVTQRTLSNVNPTGNANPRCQESGPLDFNQPTAGANPWAVFGTWFMAPMP